MDKVTLGYFRCFENIDWSLFVISEIVKINNDRQPKSVLDFMVDEATGYKVANDKETIKLILYHLNRIVRYKTKLNKVYGQSYSTKDTRKSITALKKLFHAKV